MEIKERAAYRSIFKATSIFGSAQLLVILIMLIKSKFVAVLLGTAGYGVNSLLNNPLNVILSITSMGISFSAVRDIALAKSQNDISVFNKTISVYLKLLWGTGVLGCATVILCSPLLSQWSFNDYSYTSSFLLLSVTLIFMSFSNGYVGLLKGLQMTEDAAKVSFIPSLCSAIITIPLYYLLGLNGILPAIFLTAVITFLVSKYYARNIQYEKVKLGIKEVLQGGKEMIKLGFVMTLAGLLTQLVGYFIILIITQYGNVEEVGLYNAGFTMTTMYVGLVFSSIAADYFPRLVAICNDDINIRGVANQQGEILLIVLCPIIIGFILFLPLIVRILLSDSFLAIVPFVQLMTLGMIFRAVSWTMSYIPTAKGNTRLFLTIESVGASTYLLSSYLGYIYWGLEGLGYAFIINYVVYALVVYSIVNRKYKFTFTTQFYRVLLFTVLLCSMSCFILELSGLYFYLSALAVIVLTFLFTVKELNRRVSFIAYLKNRFNGKNQA